MRDRPDRRVYGRWGVGVGVLLLVALLAGPTQAARPSGVLLTAGVTAALPWAAPLEKMKVQIPPRPPWRSAYQPPVWVPGPPPWAKAPAWKPGPPPWTKPGQGLVATKAVATGPQK